MLSVIQSACAAGLFSENPFPKRAATPWKPTLADRLCCRPTSSTKVYGIGGLFFRDATARALLKDVDAHGNRVSV